MLVLGLALGLRFDDTDPLRELGIDRDGRPVWTRFKEDRL